MLDLNYEQLRNQKISQSEQFLEEQLKISKKEVTPELVFALTDWGLSSQMDAILEVFEKQYQTFRQKVGDDKITDQGTMLKMQMNLGIIISQVVQKFLPAIKAKLDEIAFPNQEIIFQECAMVLGTDIRLLLEIENNWSVYVFRGKNIEVTQEQIEKFIARFIEYQALGMQSNLDISNLILYPGLMTQFLYKEFNFSFSSLEKEIAHQAETLKPDTE